MDHKPSLRNVICTAQEYLTLVENCPPFAAFGTASENAESLRAQIGRYNADVHAGYGRDNTQAAFEDFHATAIMKLLGDSAQLIAQAAKHPELSRYVVDGGGSEWNRVTPTKLAHHLKGLLEAEARPVSRAPSANHSSGPIEYEPHGGHGDLRVVSKDGVTTVSAGSMTSTILAAKSSKFA